MKKAEPKELYTRTCVECGKKFVTEVCNQMICSEECYNSRKKSYWHISYIKKKDKRSKQLKDEKENSFTQTIQKAKEEGISYGQLKARQYLEEQKRKEQSDAKRNRK